ncbi:hypothetical protein CC2G_007895 [Coprinopsis cinerea AmutBmut pab1-1]|nr:hypothetical protein CC2G_007895 [Coprinopsis cinerea AmutBmut pab1-1]
MWSLCHGCILDVQAYVLCASLELEEIAPSILVPDLTSVDALEDEPLVPLIVFSPST